MFKLKRVLILLFMLFASITLAGCAIKGNFVGIVSATEFEFDETFMYTEVSNTTTTYSFIDQIVVSNEATWALYSDISATNEIVSKTIDLSFGNNFVYILVTRGRKTKLYTVTVTRLNAPAIDFEDDEITMEIGESITLNPILNCIDSIDLVTFTTLETDLIRIDEGRGTALAVGTAIITASLVYDTSVSSSIIITVIDNPKSLTINATDTVFERGSTSQLSIEGGYEVTWSSNITKIADVDSNGLVTGITFGNIIITASLVTDPNVKGTITLTVYLADYALLNVKIYKSSAIGGSSGIGLTKISKNLADSKNGFYKVYAYDKTGALGNSISQKACTITTSNSSICKVSEYGDINALSTGTVSIFVRYGEFLGIITLTIIDNSDETAFYVFGPNLVDKDAQITLTAITSIIGNILWESSDTNVALVNNGQIYGVAAGTATITAYFEDGIDIRSSMDVTVIDSDASGDLIIIATKTIFFKKEIYQLSVDGDKDVVWSSSNTEIATVDSDGRVTSVESGTATITASLVTDPSVKGTINIIVCAAHFRLTVKVYQSSEIGGVRGDGLTTISKTLANSEHGYYQVYIYGISDYPYDCRRCNIISTNSSVCSISNIGTITALSAGTTMIYVSSGDFYGMVKLTIVDDSN